MSSTTIITNTTKSTTTYHSTTTNSSSTLQKNNQVSTDAKNLGLHSGAAAGNLGLVKFALDHGQSIDSALNGVLPIHAACINGNANVVQYLIERGANVNSPRHPRKLSGADKTKSSSGYSVGTTGSTALHFAAANGCTQTVELLLKNGAMVDVADKYGSTPLSVAMAKNHNDVVELLKTYDKASKFKKIKMPTLSSSSNHTTAVVVNNNTNNTIVIDSATSTATNNNASNNNSNGNASSSKDFTAFIHYLSKRRPTSNIGNNKSQKSKPSKSSKIKSTIIGTNKSKSPKNNPSSSSNNSPNNNNVLELSPQIPQIVTERQHSRSLELPQLHSKSLEEILNNKFTSKKVDEIMIIDLSDKPPSSSIYLSSSYDDESTTSPDTGIKKHKSPTKELFRKSLNLTRHFANTATTTTSSTTISSVSNSNSLTMINHNNNGHVVINNEVNNNNGGGSSRSPDRRSTRFSFSSSTTPQSNSSSINSLLMATSPELTAFSSDSSSSYTTTALPPPPIVIPEKKKRRSTDPLFDFKTKKQWSKDDNHLTISQNPAASASSDSLNRIMKRSMSESGAAGGFGGFGIMGFGSHSTSDLSSIDNAHNMNVGTSGNSGTIKPLFISSKKNNNQKNFWALKISGSDKESSKSMLGRFTEFVMGKN
ncbi:7041_t:CDS:2 [Entrophospora sp. SA101]|nr:7041_t:CDS:2 [Entrophospora sp. SA101]CAJ0902442.1 10145_t:CDS:2 [Entrophospora sp. SA101]